VAQKSCISLNHRIDANIQETHFTKMSSNFSQASRKPENIRLIFPANDANHLAWHTKKAKNNATKP